MLNVEKNKWHEKIQVFKRVKIAHMKIHHFHLFVRLFFRNMNDVFENALREIYQRNYNIYDIMNLNIYVFH